MSPEWYEAVKLYRQKRWGFASRKLYLEHLAKGDPSRKDVQAAISLLAKRYKS
jgi:hypothetical protein